MDKVIAFFSGILAVFSPPEPVPFVYSGYIEGNFVFAAPTSTGRLEEIDVTEGQLIKAGDLLFVQDKVQLTAAVAAAKAQVRVSEAQLANIGSGAREEELEVVRAQLEQARVDLDLANKTLERSKQLVEGNIISQSRLDQDASAAASAQAQVHRLEAELAAMELPARSEELVAAKASVEAANAEVERIQSDLDARTVISPVGGLIEKVYFEPGEVATAGTPVISVLPENGLTIRFYVRENERSSLTVGDEFTMQCDGCPKDYTVRLTRMDADPQFSPPIIYSREERARMVFRAEAATTEDVPLLPGQPVTLRLIR
jgi:HlyD family secretion protein